jgi:hypothetical protein
MKPIVLATALAVVFSTASFAQDHLLPDHDKTPGARLLTVPDDAKAESCLSELMGEHVEIGDAITTTMMCKPGYSKCIRNVSAATKRAVYAAYGDSQGNHHGFCDVEQGCEVDHLISIEFGGSNEQTNLWPQPYSGLEWNAHVKDRLENWYHTNVCSGHVSLKTAQEEISADWVSAFKKRIGADPESDSP